MEDVIVIPVLGDNFSYLLRCGGNRVIAIDPADAALVLNQINRYNLELVAILGTHHHSDHTAGIEKLNHKANCPVVIGDRGLGGEQVLEFGGCRVTVIATPGHTLDSVCFYFERSENNGGVVFTGDTLFIGGCGRPFECTAKAMWGSLGKVADLPGETLVCPGHDYTEENYEFALSIEPGNQTIEKLLAGIRKKRAGGEVVAESTIARERESNVFLRAGRVEIKRAVNMAMGSDAEVFAELRARKNVFG